MHYLETWLLNSTEFPLTMCELALSFFFSSESWKLDEKWGKIIHKAANGTESHSAKFHSYPSRDENAKSFPLNWSKMHEQNKFFCDMPGQFQSKAFFKRKKVLIPTPKNAKFQPNYFKFG